MDVMTAVSISWLISLDMLRPAMWFRNGVAVSAPISVIAVPDLILRFMFPDSRRAFTIALLIS